MVDRVYSATSRKWTQFYNKSLSEGIINEDKNSSDGVE